MNEMIYLSSGPGNDSATALMKRLAHEHEGGRIRILVAWASRGGVERLADALDGNIRELHVVVGGNSGSTELDALLRLRELGAVCHVAFYNDADIYHPKTYWIDGGSGSQVVSALSGSANLTEGGLFANHENLIGFTLDSDGLHLAQGAIDHFDHEWATLTDPHNDFVHRANTDEELRLLYQNGLLVSTRAARRRRRRDQRIAARVARRARTIPIRETARAGKARAFGLMDVPFVLDAEPDDVEVIRKPAPGGAPADLVGASVGTHRFYARTLTDNDVRKLLRQQTGTFEPDLGIIPRDRDPSFWHWPDDYVTIERTPGKPRDEYTATARLETPLTTGGETIGLRLWFRPDRPGHAAEHRMTPVTDGSGVNIKDFVPANFDTNGIMVVEEAGLDDAVDYIVRLLRLGDVGYSTYSAQLMHQNPGHRYGYGLVIPS